MALSVFQLGSLGSPGCCCGQKVCVMACGKVQAGAVVTIKTGSTVVFTGTTDSSGCVSPGIASGSYTVIIAFSGYTTFTGTETLGSFTHDFGGSATNVCCCKDCPLDGTATYTLTDVNGSYTMTKIGACTWQVCLTVPETVVDTQNIGHIPCNCLLPAAAGDLYVSYEMTCTSITTGTVGVARVWPRVGCQDGTAYYGKRDCSGGTGPYYQGCPTITPSCNVIAGGAGGGIGTSSLSQLPTTCHPFAWSGTLVGTNTPVDPIGGVVSVSV